MGSAEGENGPKDLLFALLKIRRGFPKTFRDWLHFRFREASGGDRGGADPDAGGDEVGAGIVRNLSLIHI